jgi:hypothetical protein
MPRLTIRLPAELKARAVHHARERGISLGELIRTSLSHVLSMEREDSRLRDPLFADDAVFTGPAPADLAANHDEHLYGPGA